jgi:hypothetical protein
MLKITNVGTDRIKRDIDANSTIFHITDRWGGIITGGTLADRMWICGDPTGPAIPFSTASPDIISIIKVADNTTIYVFDDCVLVMSDSDAVNNKKYKLDILNNFDDGDVDITDLR